MSSSESLKKPFKFFEIPVNKFKDEAIPHHFALLAEHKEVIKKECEDCTKMKVEVVTIKRIIAQLKILLYELDTLRAQVEDEDLDKFDRKTLPLRKILLSISSEYAELQKQAAATLTPSPKKQPVASEASEPSSPELRQLQLDVNLDDLKLQDKEAMMRNVEAIQSDIADLHCAYSTLNEMVTQQQEQVDTVETNVESAHNNVTAGTRHLLTAARFKASVYPVTGAMVGTCMGGPIGLLAGIKIGSLAALSCGLLGYFGGSLIKKRNTDVTRSTTTETIVQENTSPRTKKHE